MDGDVITESQERAPRGTAKHDRRRRRRRKRGIGVTATVGDRSNILRKSHQKRPGTKTKPEATAQKVRLDDGAAHPVDTASTIGSYNPDTKGEQDGETYRLVAAHLPAQVDNGSSVGDTNQIPIGVIVLAEILRAAAEINAFSKQEESVTPKTVAIEVFRVLTCLALLSLRFKLEKNSISFATCTSLILIVFLQIVQLTSRPQLRWKDPNLKLALEATTTIFEVLAVFYTIFPLNCGKSCSFDKKLPILAVSIAGLISLFITTDQLMAGGPSATDSILRATAGAACIAAGGVSLIFSRTRKPSDPLGSPDENGPDKSPLIGNPTIENGPDKSPLIGNPE